MFLHCTCNNFLVYISLYDYFINAYFPPKEFKLHEAGTVSDVLITVSLASCTVSNIHRYSTNVLMFNGVSKED